jgi:hypothetical protein
MMPELLQWLDKAVLPNLPKNARVLEIGSRNVNGSARQVLESHVDSWLGIDMIDGPGVDKVAYAVDFLRENPDLRFDVVICMEAFEHDPKWWETNTLALRTITKGGLHVVTTPTIGFPIHNYPGDYYRFTPQAHREMVMDGCGVIHQEVVGPEPWRSLATVGRKLDEMRTDSLHVIAYTLCDDLYFDHLRTWYAWHVDRYDELIVMVRRDAHGCEKVLDFCRENRISVIFADAAGKYCFNDYPTIYAHAAARGPNTWYSNIDVDEVVDRRLCVRGLARWCIAHNLVTAFAHMIDRVADDGKVAPLPDDPAKLFEAFPRRICFGATHTGWNYSKPFLRRSDFFGLHRIDNARWANSRGCSHSFELSHFDFTTGTRDRAAFKFATYEHQDIGKWRFQYDKLAQMCESGIDPDHGLLPEPDIEASRPLFGDWFSDVWKFANLSPVATISAP